MPANPPVTDWGAQRVWVIGASSGIGAEVARLLLARGARVALSARSAAALDALMGEVQAAPRAPAGHALALPLDVTDRASIERVHAMLIDQWGGCDQVLYVTGTYVPMRAQSLDVAAARRVLDTNFTGFLDVLDVVLPGLRAQGHGVLCIVASVAGYRGLPKALIYGPTKAALINLAESLYLDLRPEGIGVNLVCPGFVETPLTAGNDFRMPALISAAAAAREVVRGLERGVFETHFPKRFTRFLKFLRFLPDRWYFALVRRGTGMQAGAATARTRSA